MIIPLLGAIGLGALYFLSGKSGKKAPPQLPHSPVARHQAGFAPPQESGVVALMREWASLIETETNPEILKYAANEFEKIGYAKEAAALRAKAATLDAQKLVTTPQVQDEETGHPVDPRTLKTAADLAAFIMADTEVNGCWQWNVDAVRAFQRKVGVKDDGIWNAHSLGALSFFEPQGYGLFLNCGVLSLKDRQAPGDDVSTDITESDIQELIMSPEYATGFEQARRAHEADRA